MTKINSSGGYDYYKGYDENNKPYYNIVVRDLQIPSAGYYSKVYICNIKHVPDLFN
jgi:hypothetical protein